MIYMMYPYNPILNLILNHPDNLKTLKSILCC